MARSGGLRHKHQLYAVGDGHRAGFRYLVHDPNIARRACSEIKSPQKTPVACVGLLVGKDDRRAAVERDHKRNIGRSISPLWMPLEDVVIAGGQYRRRELDIG